MWVLTASIKETRIHLELNCDENVAHQKCVDYSESSTLEGMQNQKERFTLMSQMNPRLLTDSWLWLLGKSSPNVVALSHNVISHNSVGRWGSTGGSSAGLVWGCLCGGSQTVAGVGTHTMALSTFLTGTAGRLGSVELLRKLDLSVKSQGLSFSTRSRKQSG